MRAAWRRWLGCCGSAGVQHGLRQAGGQAAAHLAAAAGPALAQHVGVAHGAHLCEVVFQVLPARLPAQVACGLNIAGRKSIKRREWGEGGRV